tara:strand:- start:138 stop:434 length:297 start_codon:yes stop_codon:yes gene_type:complete
MELNNIIKEVNLMSEEELTKLVYVIKDRRDILRYGKLKEFKIGDKVKWTHGQGMNKEDYEGEVYKVNPKTIATKVDGKPWCRWRISPSMLTKIEGDES